MVLCRPRLVVLAAVLAAFANGISGDFVYDDVSQIERNPAVRRLWPPWEAMTVGNGLPARLLPSWSFAVDHAVWGNDPRGYHLANILIHAAGAVALYEIARCTLASPRVHAPLREHADSLALGIAVIWAVHPLQTQAVTYVYQRIESMAGMFSLVSLAFFAHAAVRGFDTRWLAGCVAAAAAAMASKESAIVLPLVTLAYDWTFWAEPPRTLRTRLPFYILLSATTSLVALQLWLQQAAYSEFREAGPGPVAYALTQPGVILHYLRLVVWPTGQCLEYDWPIATRIGDIAIPLAVVGGGVLATAVGLARRSPCGWLGAAFLLWLAPTSSIMPVAAPAAEHRMYLPLAAVVAVLVCGLWVGLAAIGRRQGLRPSFAGTAGFVLIGLVIALGTLTHLRNRLYESREIMWRHIAATRRDNPRALEWMAGFAQDDGDMDSAIRYATAVVKLRPRSGIFGQLAANARKVGRLDVAESTLRQYLELTRPLLPPDDVAILGAKAALASIVTAARGSHDAEVICADVLESTDGGSAASDAAHEESRSICRTIEIQSALQRGDVPTAMSLAARNHADVAAHLGPLHSSTRQAAVTWAAVLQVGGDASGAERVLRESLAAADRVAWRRTVDTTSTREALASLLESVARYDDAVEQRRILLDDAVRSRQVDDTTIARAHISLLEAETARAGGRGLASEEERLSGMAARTAVDALGTLDAQTQRALVNHAVVLLQAGKADQADRLLVDHLRDAEHNAGSRAGVHDLTILRSGLADLYERTGRLDESLALRHEVLRDCLTRHGPESVITQRAAAATRAAARAAPQSNAHQQSVTPQPRPDDPGPAER